MFGLKGIEGKDVILPLATWSSFLDDVTHPIQAEFYKRLEGNILEHIIAHPELTMDEWVELFGYADYANMQYYKYSYVPPSRRVRNDRACG